MSDDSIPDGDGEQSDKATDESSELPDDAEPESSFSRSAWEELATDPHPGRDLNYALSDWEQFQTLDGSEQIMFLPKDEEALRDDAFVVTDRDGLVDLGGKR